MSLGWALLIWLIILIVVFLIARYFRITTGASIILGLIIATVILGLINQPLSVGWNMQSHNAASSIYWLIMILVPLIVIIYAIWKAATSIEPQGKVVSYVPFVNA